MASLYLWVKAAHIVFVIFWMAGLLMLPRFYAYHAECEPGGDEDARWQAREQKLLRIILTPAMLATWAFGLWLAHLIGAFGSSWLHLKLVLVVGLTVLHGLLARWRRSFLDAGTRRSSRFYRAVNEIPSIAIILIVLLVVLKPG